MESGAEDFPLIWLHLFYLLVLFCFYVCFFFPGFFLLRVTDFTTFCSEGGVEDPTTTFCCTVDDVFLHAMILATTTE